MSTQASAKNDVKTATKDMVQMLNNKDLKAVMEFFTSNMKFVGPADNPDSPKGKEELRKTLSMIIQAVPDARISIRDMMTSAKRSAARIIFKGKHSGGNLWDIPPSNKRVEINGHISLNMSPDGKFDETWIYIDHLGIKQQAGQTSYEVGTT